MDYNAGVAAYKRGDDDHAITLLGNALDSYKLEKPEEFVARYYRGMSCMRKGSTQEPAAYYRVAVYELTRVTDMLSTLDMNTVSKRYEKATYFYACALARYKYQEATRGDYGSCIRDLDTAIRQNPRLAEAFYIRGLVMYKWHAFDKAVADFDMALRIKPDFTEAVTERNKAMEQQRKSATGQG